ncbi:sodium:proton antiporter [Pedobacter sp. HMF7647]|uniref:Sodium:proton antiporter n=1 Tax=Hufsiella arboris TaxID=2695275 RepID=A0A7K1Y8S8_9SPHI|nr:sodium:proton antiporter [Hufsiella arboris]MXV50448.1 sodium:proton antiporter [Hufsiella arboris]
MSSYSILIILSGLVVLSYLFDLFASKTRVPSVLLLLFLGIGLRYLTDYFNIRLFDFNKILPTLGSLGLILIVFEGALELKYSNEKNKFIINTLLIAFLILITTTIVIALLLSYQTGNAFMRCFVNAIPLSIISSAIAIPSVSGLSKRKKEFVIYESSFSDILGIVFFNFAIENQTISITSFVNLAKDTILVIVFSAAACLVLLYLMGKIRHHIKFFLIISILIMLYALGQQYQLSSLILILAFGLFLNNANQIHLPWFQRYFIYHHLSRDLNQLLQLSAESAFLLRTFFFVIFGFTMRINELQNLEIVEYGLIILCLIYLIRIFFMKMINKTDILPETFISPRGLISILLFFHLPTTLRLTEVGTGLLFMLIIGTSIVMTTAIFLSSKKEV